MADRSAAVADAVTAWLERGRAAGWLSRVEAERIQALERATPADLFAGGAARPLVVALFGGTGVGKSSLLNRLAGETIARVGVERPTSHEITLYLHHEVQLSDLPDGLPVDRVRVARHHHDRRRGLLWVDMPDIDSTTAGNRALALAWLPHVDLVIYVVSPERYRDDAGWRLLRARGHRHGWLFVMNRSDEGNPTQMEDFQRQLHAAGFTAPVVVATSCVEEAEDDGLDTLEAAIVAAYEAHGIEELERLGLRVRLADLRRAVVAAQVRFGDETAWRRIHAEVRKAWRGARTVAVEGLTWPIAETASWIALRRRVEGGTAAPLGGRLLRRLLARQAPRPGGEEGRREPEDGGGAEVDLTALWDRGSQGRLDGMLDEVEVETRRLGIAVTPIRARLQGALDTAPATIQRHLKEGLVRAYARPGSRLQRGVRRVAAIATGLLPLLAGVRIAYDIFIGYGRALAGEAPFLGLGFATHALLLIGVAWLIPFLVHRLLRPDPRRVAEQGLSAGLDRGLDEIERAVDEAGERTSAERDALIAEAAGLLEQIDRDVASAPGEVAGSLSRFIAAPDSARM